MKKSILPHEVAEVLGFPMGNLDFAAGKPRTSPTFESKLLKLIHFLNILFEVRELNENVKPEKDLSAQDLKSIIEGMEVEMDVVKQLFVRWLSYYYMEQFVLCGTKLSNSRHKL
ncbi:hypothetical protein AgCh_022982 [Apium graveolens]